MVKRKRVARLPTAAAHVEDVDTEADMFTNTATAFAHAHKQFSAQEAADYPDWGLARELAFYSSGGKAEKPPYLLNEEAEELSGRPGRKSGKRATSTRKGEVPQALHRSWAAFWVYKLAYEERNGARLELVEETSITKYNSDVAKQVSGRTRGSVDDRKSELPPELQVWKREFKCWPRDHSTTCAFGFTATVEFVGNEWVVRVADGQFHHSHALLPPDEQPTVRTGAASVVQEATGSPLLRTPTTPVTRTFLDSPLTPTSDDGRLTRNIYLAVRPVANAIIDELMEWKEEFVLSELANLTNYLTRLQQRGREIARRAPISPIRFERPLDMLVSATAVSPDPPLYCGLPQGSWAAVNDAAASDVTPRAEPARSTWRGGAEVTVAKRRSRPRGGSEDEDPIPTAERGVAVLSDTAVAGVRKRTPRPVEPTEGARASRSTAAASREPRTRGRPSTSVVPTVQEMLKTRRTRAATEAKIVDPPKPSRRRSRPVSADGSSEAGSIFSVPDDESEISHASSSRVASAQLPKDSSTHRTSRRQRGLVLTIDTSPQVSAKRRRIVPPQQSSPSKAPAEAMSDTSVSERERVNLQTDRLPSAVVEQNPEVQPTVATASQATTTRLFAAFRKSRAGTEEAVASTQSTESVQGAEPAKTAEPSTETPKPPRPLLKSVIVVTPPSISRKKTSSSQSPALPTPSAVSPTGTDAIGPSNTSDETPVLEVEDAVAEKQTAPRDAATPVEPPATTKTMKDTVAKPPVVTLRTRSPRALTKPPSEPSETSVVSADNSVFKAKLKASMPSKKQPKKPKAPVEMFSRLSRYPPLPSFQGRAPTPGPGNNSKAAKWDVVLVPRLPQASQEPSSTEKAAPAKPSAPQKPRIGEVLL